MATLDPTNGIVVCALLITVADNMSLN